MARQQKTERQRAEEALEVAIRKRNRLLIQKKDATELHERITRELDEAQDLVEYRAQHPALQSTTPTTTQENA